MITQNGGDDQDLEPDALRFTSIRSGRMVSRQAELTLPLRCRHCGNRAPMAVVATYEQVLPYRDNRAGKEWEAGPVWELVQCPECSNVSLLRIDWHEYMGPSTTRVQVVFPLDDRVLQRVPSDIDRTYGSALKVQDIDSSACAVLLERVIRKICVDKGVHVPPNQPWHECLSVLATKGEIPARLAEVGQRLAAVQRRRVDTASVDFTEAEVAIFRTICRATLTYAYTASHLLDDIALDLEHI